MLFRSKLVCFKRVNFLVCELHPRFLKCHPWGRENQEHGEPVVVSQQGTGEQGGQVGPAEEGGAGQLSPLAGTSRAGFSLPLPPVAVHQGPGHPAIPGQMARGERGELAMRGAGAWQPGSWPHARFCTKGTGVRSCSCTCDDSVLQIGRAHV